MMIIHKKILNRSLGLAELLLLVLFCLVLSVHLIDGINASQGDILYDANDGERKDDGVKGQTGDNYFIGTGIYDMYVSRIVVSKGKEEKLVLFF